MTAIAIFREIALHNLWRDLEKRMLIIHLRVSLSIQMLRISRLGIKEGKKEIHSERWRVSDCYDQFLLMRTCLLMLSGFTHDDIKELQSPVLDVLSVFNFLCLEIS